MPQFYYMSVCEVDGNSMQDDIHTFRQLFILSMSSGCESVHFMWYNHIYLILIRPCCHQAIAHAHSCTDKTLKLTYLIFLPSSVIFVPSLFFSCIAERLIQEYTHKINTHVHKQTDTHTGTNKGLKTHTHTDAPCSISTKVCLNVADASLVSYYPQASLSQRPLTAFTVAECACVCPCFSFFPVHMHWIHNEIRYFTYTYMLSRDAFFLFGMHFS